MYNVFKQLLPCEFSGVVRPAVTANAAVLRVNYVPLVGQSSSRLMTTALVGVKRENRSVAYSDGSTGGKNMFIRNNSVTKINPKYSRGRRLGGVVGTNAI